MFNILSSAEVDALRKFCRATNYLSAAQIYLHDNILLENPLKFSNIKPRLLGHWGTCPGINFLYAHIYRSIAINNNNMMVVVGPGHGFPAIQANLFMEKSLTRFYPKQIPYSKKGIQEICSNFSAPYGYPSHANPAAPGAILEGGELGYSLSVSYGAILDNPDLVLACLIGDGEAETGPLAASWQINKLINPAENGAVLPVLHINGYKISGPTFFGRMSDVEIHDYFRGLGYDPIIVDSEKKEDIHQQMANAMDNAIHQIKDIQNRARSGEDVECPRWPMIAMRTPKGWSGTAFDGDQKLEGNCLSHQVIHAKAKTDMKALKSVEKWLKSYHFDKLVEKKRPFQFCKEIRSLLPKKSKAPGSNPIALGGTQMHMIDLPSLEKLAIKGGFRGKKTHSSMKVAGTLLAEAVKRNPINFRIFSPDETYSNKIDAVFQHTTRAWQWPIEEWDKDIARSGRVLEILSEHSLFGLQHGYNVTGRHSVFVSYEAFVQVVASMADQYVKFLKASQEVSWRKPLPGMNIILTSLLERQDHNGFSHQNPSFISSMLEKDGELIRAYFPPDANTMLVTLEETLHSRDSLNMIVVGKKENYQWLSLTEARTQMARGIMTWDFASDKNPDVVFAASGDYVTKESLAAISILKKILPETRVRFVNISELSVLGVGDPTIASDDDLLDTYFTKDKGVIYNFHGYPHSIKKLLFDYRGASRFSVHGYQENGSTTSPFDMHVRNETSRYHLVLDAVKILHQQGNIEANIRQKIEKDIMKKLEDHRRYIIKNGDDPKSITEWRWE